MAHTVGRYADGPVHTNGIESFWGVLKRSYKGVYHHWSGKHLHRYVNECRGRLNARASDYMGSMRVLLREMEGKRLTYAALVAALDLPEVKDEFRAPKRDPEKKSRLAAEE